MFSVFHRRVRGDRGLGDLADPAGEAAMMTPADMIPLGFGELFVLALAAGFGLALGVLAAIDLYLLVCDLMKKKSERRIP